MGYLFDFKITEYYLNFALDVTHGLNESLATILA